MTSQTENSAIQPMIVMNSEDGLPDLVAVMLARWAWRYRSELTPLYAAGTVLGVASWLHAGHRHWWVLVPAIAAMTAAALAAFGNGLDFIALTGMRGGSALAAAAVNALAYEAC